MTLLSKNKSISDSMTILLANTITYLITIVTTRLIAGTHSIVEYGLYSQTLTIVTLLVACFSLGTQSCPSFFLPQVYDEKAKIKIIINLYFLCFAIFFFIIISSIFFFDNIVAYYRNNDLYSLEMVIALLPGIRIIYALYIGIMVAQGKTKVSTKVSCIRALILVIVTFIMCEYKQSIINILVAILVVETLFAIFTLYVFIPANKDIIKQIDYKKVKNLLKFGVPLGMSLLIGTLCSQIDKLLIARLMPIESLAVYSNMSTELPLAAISGAFIAVISPYIVKMVNNNQVEKAVEVWGNIIEIVFIVLSFIILFLFVFAEEAIFVLYSELYLSGVDIFRIYILLEFSRITYFGLLLRAGGKSHLILLCSFFTLILNLVLDLFFYYILHMGLIGFALATFVSTFGMQFFQLKISCKIYSLSFRNIFPWYRLAKITIVILTFSLLMMTIKKYLESYNIIYNLLIAGGTGLFFFLCYITVMKNEIIRLYNKTKEIEI